MQAYFKAWALNDITIRDYRSYFIPTLCVLEGAWIRDSSAIDEPFASDRHYIDAATWQELNDMTRFLLNSGRKNNLENLPYLPSAIRDMENREAMFAKIDRATNTAIKIVKRPDSTPSEVWAFISNTVFPNGLTATLARTNQGLFLFMAHGSRSHVNATAGRTTVSIACLPGSGCSGASVAMCPAGSTCDLVDGSGSITMNWQANASAVLAYGPLRSCWNLTLNYTNSQGYTGGAFFWRGGGMYYNATRVPTANNTGITINGCSYAATPVMANFEYRIFCKKINVNLPFNRFRPVDDIGQQMASNPALPLSNLTRTRRALFQLNSRDSDKFFDDTTGYSLIDSLMEQVPGKDNNDAYLEESLNGVKTKHYLRNETLNVAYYSRFYRRDDGDDSGRYHQRRGFNDDTLWAARTTMSKVSGLRVSTPEEGEIEEKWFAHLLFLVALHRPSYVLYSRTWAVPLEIIYLTPLGSWNPYNIPHFAGTDGGETGGRNGGFSLDKVHHRCFGDCRSAFVVAEYVLPVGLQRKQPQRLLPHS